MFATAGVREGNACAIHAQQPFVIIDPDGIAIAAEHIPVEVRLVRVRNTDSVSMEEIQALELKSSFKLEC
jgi:hypothetical protein